MNNEHHNNFDLIRLFAAAQVIFSHSYFWLKIPVNSSLEFFSKLFPGVAIFFVISGFLITKSYIENRSSLGSYFLGRGLRIYPALWVNLVLMIMLLSMSGAGKLNNVLAFNHWPYHIVLFATGQMWGGSIGGYPYSWNGFYKFFPNDVLWTITVELGFYILAPFILYHATKNISKKVYLSISIWFIISFGCAILNTKWLNILFPNHYFYAYISMILRNIILPYLWIFLLGSCIYLQWHNLKPWIAGKFWYWLAAYLLFNFIFPNYDIYHTSHHPLDSYYRYITLANTIRVCLLAICVISCAYSSIFLNFISGKTDLSYGMYLYHMPVISTLLFFGQTKFQYLWIVVYGSTLLLAGFSWFLIEKPSLRLKSQLIKRYTFQSSTTLAVTEYPKSEPS